MKWLRQSALGGMIVILSSAASGFDASTARPVNAIDEGVLEAIAMAFSVVVMVVLYMCYDRRERFLGVLLNISRKCINLIDVVSDHKYLEIYKAFVLTVIAIALIGIFLKMPVLLSAHDIKEDKIGLDQIPSILCLGRRL